MRDPAVVDRGRAAPEVGVALDLTPLDRYGLIVGEQADAVAPGAVVDGCGYVSFDS
jgi:hypothetical protein